MGYEVEVKYRSVDHNRVRRLLLERGATEDPAVEQEDVYMRHPSRDFALTREALRIRRVGSENLVTYKGPRFPGPTKTREEIELAFTPGEPSYQDLTRLFANLGFEAVATIRKRRVPFHLVRTDHRIEVTLDRAEGLGDFAEIEALTGDPARLPAAQAAVLALAEELGLDQVEPRSYLRMALEARESAGHSG